VLVNNAGISGWTHQSQRWRRLDQHCARYYETNVFGPVRVPARIYPACSEKILRAPVVVNVSRRRWLYWPRIPIPQAHGRRPTFPFYASSKAALNMLTVRYAGRLPEDAHQLDRSGLHTRPTSTNIGARRPSSRAPKQSVRYAANTQPIGPTGGSSTASRHRTLVNSRGPTFARRPSSSSAAAHSAVDVAVACTRVCWSASSRSDGSAGR